MKIMNMIKPFCLAVLIAGISVTSQGVLVVDFNPTPSDYTDASWDNSAGPISESLSLTTPIFASSTTAPIYGGVLSGGLGSNTTARARIANLGGVDTMQIRQNNSISTGDGNNIYQYALLLWKAEDFLDISATSFDQSVDSSFSITATGFSDGPTNNETRFVILDNGTYYIAGQDIEIDGGNIAGNLNGTELTWAEWSNPWTDIGNAGGSELGDGLTYGSQTFSNVEAVGFVNFLSRDSANSIFQMTDFQVAAVPEPSTYVLLSALFALGFVLYRRRAQ